MKRWLRLILLTLSTANLAGCTYTLAVSQTNLPSQRTVPVEASVEKYVFIGYFSNDFTLKLVDKLKEKCPHGDIRGITTQDMATIYFPAIFWVREIKAHGYCVPSKVAAALEPARLDLVSFQEQNQ